MDTRLSQREKREREREKRKDTVETGKILESQVKQNKKRPMWTIVCVCTLCISMYRCTEAKGVKVGGYESI